jgi:type IV pilus assembly protein PilX
MISISKQSGAVLFLSLVILLVLTLLAMSGMQGSVMQERMATAQRDGMLALEIAERAMFEAEAALDGLSNLDDFGTSKGFYESTAGSSTPAPSPFAAGTWSKDTGTGEPDNAISASAVDGVEAAYFFDYKGKVTLDSEGQLPRDLGQYGAETPTEFDYARIVVRAPGPSGNSARLLEGFYVFVPGGLAGGNE